MTKKFFICYLLAANFNPDNLNNAMCKTQLNIDWQGLVYDCDFNQALGLVIPTSNPYIGSINIEEVIESQIITDKHCLGCFAGSGSSCKGSLA